MLRKKYKKYLLVVLLNLDLKDKVYEQIKIQISENFQLIKSSTYLIS